MSTVNIIRFNDADQIISTHAGWVESLVRVRSKYAENYVTVAEFDFSGLCELSELKKGATINGLWRAISEQNTEKYLIKLMAKSVRKEVNATQLARELDIYHIEFDVWMEKYQEKGEALALKINAEDLAEAEKSALSRANLEACETHFAGACFSLPAIAGKMGQGIYFTVQIPFGQVVQMFKFNEELVPVELRAQRELNEKRAQAIADYIVTRRRDYTLPALTASVSEAMKFEPVTGFSNVGAVQIPMGATMLINDGQHRRRGIELALQQDSSLKDQSVSVVLFYDEGLQRSQQMFADINDKMVKPAKAISILFDRTNKLNAIVIESIEALGIKHAVEFERSSPRAKSSKVWGITALKRAAEFLTGLNDKKAAALSFDEQTAYKKLFQSWLSAMIDNVGGALKLDVEQGSSVTVSESRLYRVSTHAVFLHSVALASAELCGGFKQDLLKLKEVKSNNAYLEAMQGIGKLQSEKKVNEHVTIPSFSELEAIKPLSVMKSDSLWRSRIVNVDGTMNPTANGIKLGAYVILETLALTIPSAIEEINTLVFEAEQDAA